MHGTSSRPSKCAASTRPWPAIMPSSSSISTGLVKPNSPIEAAICATCWSLCVRFWRRGSAPRTGAELAGDNAVLFVDQHRVGEAKFADRGGDLRDLLVAVRAFLA